MILRKMYTIIFAKYLQMRQKLHDVIYERLFLYLDFLTLSHMNILRDGVGYDHSFEARVVDPKQVTSKK
jgi:hypothetical protein